MVAVSEDRFWNLPLDRPIEIEHGGQRLATLRDVGTFILALPETLKMQPSWQAATEAVLEAAQSGDIASVTIALHMALLLSGQNARSVWNDEADEAWQSGLSGGSLADDHVAIRHADGGEVAPPVGDRPAAEGEIIRLTPAGERLRRA
jgi:hypothetical protein